MPLLYLMTLLPRLLDCRLEDRFPSYGVCLLPTKPMQRALVRFIARFHDMYYEPVYRRLYSQVMQGALSFSGTAALQERACCMAMELLAGLLLLNLFPPPHLMS